MTGTLQVGAKLTTVTFVHGTGVREPAFSKMFARVSSELHARLPDLDVQPCYWGGVAGARLWHDGISVPSYDSTRAIAPDGQPEDEEEEIVLWSLLYRDALWELRMLTLAGPRGGELSPGRQAPGDVLDAKVQALEPSGDLAAALESAGLTETFESARIVIASAQPYRQALATASDDLGALRLAVARAIVAEALTIDDSVISAVPDAAARDRVVVLLTDEFGGQERGVPGLVRASVQGLVLRPATALAARKRGAITDVTTSAAGDILLYQARGGAIRDMIAKKVESADEPVVLIAHSLGGIAAVDLLAGRPFPQVRLLVTVGSQAPLLYEIGALVSLDHDDPLPGHMPPWLNIYDTHDLLSYLAAPLFPDRAADVEVRNGQPFPQSHSAYWANPAVWDAIVSRLP
jgi:hypothetical protein